MDAKLYVGHLAPGTTAEALHMLFAQAGPVVAVQLLGNNADVTATRSAHVTMATRAAAQKAIDQFHQTDLAGSVLTVAFAPMRGVAVGQPGQLSAFGATDRRGQSKPGKPGPTRGGLNSSLGAFGGSPSAPTPPRRRGGSQRH